MLFIRDPGAFLRCLWLFLASCGVAVGANVDPTGFHLPRAGDSAVSVLAPTLVQLTWISSPGLGEPAVDLEHGFAKTDFIVTIDGQPATVSQLGFKRRALYAPPRERDLRVSTDIFLQLSQPIADGAKTIRVEAKAGPLWSDGRVFSTNFDALRYSPALHVNQEGYPTHTTKLAMVGYYAGSLGELAPPSQEFSLRDTHSGETVFKGTLRVRRDAGFSRPPLPYQQVYEADFSSFDQPGEYQLVVVGLGASLPFRIDEGEWMNFARAYALGLYHQRCGTALALPFTRFTHDVCHAAPADVPLPVPQFAKTWDVLASAADDRVKPEHADQQIRAAGDLFYPYVRRGKVDTHGGHHDAGDYSKYLINSASLVHVLVFGVDAFPGVAELDNLGLPESGDGISDVLQEAKLESDFLSRMQDEDGGFYFLVYPRDRRYEDDVTPDHGDPQIVWPKTTAATAAAVAALAQCASSAEFKRHFPADAQRYLEQAKLGWKFLLAAIERRGKEGSYQRLTHYGDDFNHNDELAWAAAELFVATGDLEYEHKLREWYPSPADAATMQWGWRRASFSYGNALRAYAFAARTGRLTRNQLDGGYLAKCESELRRAGDDVLRDSERSAYGVSYPEASKRIGVAGWIFASDEAFDLTVAYQLRANPKYAEAVAANVNYEAGGNPVNRVYITGLGVGRQREVVSQFAANDQRVLPPSGIPLGCVQSQFDFMDRYRTDLRNQTYPRDDTFPMYDRWTDTHNLSTEFVVVNQGRSLASLAFWAAQSSLKTQKWRAAAAKITGGGDIVGAGEHVTFRLECPELDLTPARVVWEARDQEPAIGPEFSFTSRRGGSQWVEAEATLPDGRRVFARREFRVNATVMLWVNGSLPAGATGSAQGGDDWNWIKPASKPAELASYRDVPQHESALASGIHEHGFDNARDQLEVDRGDILFAYLFIDPSHRPKTVMLEWNDGSFDHRAYWGENMIPWGRVGTPSQWHMGDLPAAGKWVRLEVPARAVGLEGKSVKGMSFRVYDGRARWDAAGKMSASAKASGQVKF